MPHRYEGPCFIRKRGDVAICDKYISYARGLMAKAIQVSASDDVAFLKRILPDGTICEVRKTENGDHIITITAGVKEDCIYDPPGLYVGVNGFALDGHSESNFNHIHIYKYDKPTRTFNFYGLTMNIEGDGLATDALFPVIDPAIPALHKTTPSFYGTLDERGIFSLDLSASNIQFTRAGHFTIRESGWGSLGLSYIGRTYHSLQASSYIGSTVTAGIGNRRFQEFTDYIFNKDPDYDVQGDPDNGFMLGLTLGAGNNLFRIDSDNDQFIVRPDYVNAFKPIIKSTIPLRLYKTPFVECEMVISVDPTTSSTPEDRTYFDKDNPYKLIDLDISTFVTPDGQTITADPTLTADYNLSFSGISDGIVWNTRTPVDGVLKGAFILKQAILKKEGDADYNYLKTPHIGYRGSVIRVFEFTIDQANNDAFTCVELEAKLALLGTNANEDNEKIDNVYSRNVTSTVSSVIVLTTPGTGPITSVTNISGSLSGSEYTTQIINIDVTYDYAYALGYYENTLNILRTNVRIQKNGIYDFDKVSAENSSSSGSGTLPTDPDDLGTGSSSSSVNKTGSLNFTDPGCKISVTLYDNYDTIFDMVTTDESDHTEISTSSYGETGSDIVGSPSTGTINMSGTKNFNYGKGIYNNADIKIANPSTRTYAITILSLSGTYGVTGSFTSTENYVQGSGSNPIVTGTTTSTKNISWNSKYEIWHEGLMLHTNTLDSGSNTIETVTNSDIWQIDAGFDPHMIPICDVIDNSSSSEGVSTTDITTNCTYSESTNTPLTYNISNRAVEYTWSTYNISNDKALYRQSVDMYFQKEYIQDSYYASPRLVDSLNLDIGLRGDLTQNYSLIHSDTDFPDLDIIQIAYTKDGNTILVYRDPIIHNDENDKKNKGVFAMLNGAVYDLQDSNDIQTLLGITDVDSSWYDANYIGRHFQGL